jgi:hypothetical protein
MTWRILDKIAKRDWGPDQGAKSSGNRSLSSTIWRGVNGRRDHARLKMQGMAGMTMLLAIK